MLVDYVAGIYSKMTSFNIYTADGHKQRIVYRYDGNVLIKSQL